MSSLSEDVKVVLPAADLLDHGLTQLYNTGNGANSEDLYHYPVSLYFLSFILTWPFKLEYCIFVFLIASHSLIRSYDVSVISNVW